MKTDVEIAQEAQMQHIREIAAKLGLTGKEWSRRQAGSGYCH